MSHTFGVSVRVSVSATSSNKQSALPSPKLLRAFGRRHSLHCNTGTCAALDRVSSARGRRAVGCTPCASGTARVLTPAGLKVAGPRCLCGFVTTDGRQT